MDYIFYQVAAVNGFDSFGHYLRARPDRQHLLDATTRAPVAGCSANFASSPPPRPRAPRRPRGSDPVLRRTAAALQGKDPDSRRARCRR